jgi:hypothetical protein
MKNLAWVLLMLMAVCPLQAQRHSRSSGGKGAHVEGYRRKSGIYVRPHDRAAPGMGTHKSATVSGSHRSYSHHSSVKSYSRRSRSSSSHSSAAATHGTQRSRAARDAFEHGHPCPSTGKRSGACPGYVVDHVKALACGGADDPSNMQWQTVGAAKAKDKTERVGCR